MKNKVIIGIVVVIAVVVVGYQFGGDQLVAGIFNQHPVGGQRDAHGCLTPAGYSYDEQVGACVREFDLTDNIKQGAKIAVDYIGRSYALTLVSFNSYEDKGSFDFTFQKADGTQTTVKIKNWQVTE